MLSQDQIIDFKIKPELIYKLESPIFATNKSLWTKIDENKPSNFFKNLKKYEFTKIGKTLGFQTTRFLALSQKTLYYFDLSSESPRGRCDIQNVYCQWNKLAENRYLFMLNNINSSTAYMFRQDSFISDKRNELARYTVQLGFYNKYNIIEELGQGSFATVYRVIDNSTKEHFSAKVFNRSTPVSSISHQVQILRRIVGVPHVCQYSGIFQTDSQIIILTKFIAGRDLRTVINYHNELESDEIKTIIFGVSSGIYQCHKNNIIHRDIKPQNIIINLDTMKPTVIDFGLSLDIKKPFTLNRCGTDSYMAPEVYNYPQKNEPYNSKCDIFSLGILSHMLMLGNNPLKTCDEKKLVNRKNAFCWNQQKAKSLWGQKGYEFLEKTLSENVNHRWNINEVLKSQFLGSYAELNLEKFESCSTLQDRPTQFDF